MSFEDEHVKTRSILGAVILSFLNESRLPFDHVACVLMATMLQEAIAVGVTKDEMVQSLVVCYDCISKVVKEQSDGG